MAVTIDSTLGVQVFNGSASGTTVTGTPGNHSTAGAGELICLVINIITSSGTVPTVSTVSLAGLTWSRRSHITNPSGPLFNSCLEFWTAPAPSSVNFNTDTLTITVSSGLSATDITFELFAVENVDTSSPFDANGSLPVEQSGGSGAAPTCTLSTSSAFDLLMFFSLNSAGAVSVQPSGWVTQQQGEDGNLEFGFYTQSVSSTQSSLGVADGSAATNKGWVGIADAFTVAAGSETGTGILAFAGISLAGAGDDISVASSNIQVIILD